MKEKILIILLGKENEEMEIKTVDGEYKLITILKINKSNTPHKILGMRYHTVYCETCFTTLYWRDFIEEVIRPYATLKGGKGLIYV